jgi:hypothetical protein
MLLNQSGDLKSQTKEFKLATGNYPESIRVDQICLTNENRTRSKERGIKIMGILLGKSLKIPVFVSLRIDAFFDI